MRLIDLQSGKVRQPDVAAASLTPAPATSKPSPTHQPTSGYDGAIGKATTAPATKAAGKAHSPHGMVAAEAQQAAAVLNGKSAPAEKLAALHQLADLADHAPNAVREALRYGFGTPKHTLAEYEAKLATSLGTEGAKLYMEQMHTFADRMIKADTPKICLVNATFTGGGVAEMFQTCGDILQQLGIEVEWQKTWDHDGDYGEIGRKAFDAFQGGGTVITDAEHERWANHNALLSRVYQGMANDPEVGAIFLEDHHAIHFIPEIKKQNPDKRIIWRSHVDMAGVLDGKEAGTNVWQKTIRPNLEHLGPNDAVFFQPGSVPQKEAFPCSVFVCPPGIDPLSPKNQRLTWDEAFEILRREVPGLDSDKKYVVTGGRFVPWKGNVVVERAFLSIAGDYPDFGLFVFAGIGSGDERKIRERDLFDASLAESKFKTVYRMDDRTSVEIGAAYNLAAHWLLPYIAGSIREGYGMVGDEAACQGAVPMTTLQGGFSRYGENFETAHFSANIADIANNIVDPTRMYSFVDGKVIASPEAKALEERVATALRGIFDAHGNDPEYAERYRSAASVAERITLENSLPVMCRNYIAAASATPIQLARAAERVKSQGAAHVATVADVMGEHIWPSKS